MAELTNSTRRAYKATYVQIEVDKDNPEEVALLKKTKRGFDKMSFVANLALHSSE